MRMSIIISVLGQVHELKGIVAQILRMGVTDYETVIINNTIDPQGRAEWRHFIHTYLQPQHLVYIENEENPGNVKILQQGYEKSSGDVLAFIHSDLFIYEYGWDKKVLDLFEQYPDVGLAGFFGQKGMHLNGGRQDCLSNMLEAEIHGSRMIRPFEYVVATDGFSLICRREMLDKGKGFDQDYVYHHVYDKAIGMDSLHRGYKNICVNVPVHHWSGKTANSAEYQNWINEKMKSTSGDMDCMRINLDKFNQKWGSCLPLIVDQNGNLNRPVIKT